MSEHRCLILACGALANEIVSLKKQLGLGDADVKLQCLPAEFHNTPHKIAPRIAEILEQSRQDYDRVLIGYGECGTGGALDKVLAEYDAERLPHAHCYEFFATSTLFGEITDAEIGSFFVTDYLVRNFDRLVIGGLGLDRYPHLRDSYFGNYRDLVYLAQTEDAGLQAKAAAAAEKIGLRYVFRLVGMGDLAGFVARAGAKAHV